MGVYYSNDDVRVEELPVPKIGPDELLLKVLACGICGSDVLKWYRLPQAPRVLGHEATGTIEKIGSNITNCSPGDRIFVSHHVPCNTCNYCLGGHHTACETLHKTNYFPGGFSQYLRIPNINVKYGLYRLPLSMSYEEGTFIEPLGCVVRSQRRVNLQKEDSLLVLGCGISGLLHIQLAKSRGIKNIVAADVNPYRLELSKKFGATFAIDAIGDLPDKLRKVNGGKLASKVIVSTGAVTAALTALNCVDSGGTIMYFAVPPPKKTVPLHLSQLWKKEVTIQTSYGAAPIDLKKSLELLTTRQIKVKKMITHRFSLQDIQKGFNLVVRPSHSLKVIVTPHSNSLDF